MKSPTPFTLSQRGWGSYFNVCATGFSVVADLVSATSCWY